MELRGLNIDVSDKGKAKIFRLSGEIRTDIYSDFLEFFRTKAEASNIILDFQNVKYMSSAGVGALFNINKVANENNKKLVIFGLNPSVKKIIELTKLSNAFVITDTEEEALKKL
ncbi:MAG: STAS domain-containing protein [Spirochaetes bacterium]|nr:STAS domain-containing protein [Spirochaetota bacterium]